MWVFGIVFVSAPANDRETTNTNWAYNSNTWGTIGRTQDLSYFIPSNLRMSDVMDDYMQG
jgi:hypothetical protein